MSKTSRIILWCVLIAVLAMCIVLYLSLIHIFRGVLGERRMGHSGTLDPMATGLLVVFAGRATRAVSFSENHSKCYEARLRLGLTTDTQDTTGTVLSLSLIHISAGATARGGNEYERID